MSDLLADKVRPCREGIVILEPFSYSYRYEGSFRCRGSGADRQGRRIG